MNRREFSEKSFQTIISYALLDSLFNTQAFSKTISPITTHWAIQLNEYCQDLRKQQISLQEWQQRVEELYQKIELEEILKFINFEKLIRGFQFPDLGVSTRTVNFPKLTGLPEKTAFLKKIFGLRKDRAIIPHGHSNMSSAHLILTGEMHLRHYQKIRQEDKHLIIKPSLDKHIKIGQSSSISDEKDNVHWFIANTATAFTFDVIMLDLDGKKYDIHNLDMYENQSLSNGTLRVPILDVETALNKYGKDTHH